MIGWKNSALGAALALAPVTAGAQEATAIRGAELGLGILDHGIRHPFRTAPPPGYDLYEGEEERGTVDVQLVFRSKPIRVALQPRLTAKLQINTDGRTSFASIGAEWRQHVLHGRLYGQIGIGLAVHDGYLNPVDPFAFPIGSPGFRQRYAIYSTRTSFGSPVLFNPNLSLGLRLDRRWAIEAAYEHFSHGGVFGEQNPGIDTLGLRLVRTIGRGR